MKAILLIALVTATLFLIPNLNLAQSPPTLGSASTFALFTAAGAFSNAGASTFVTGDVGTNVGAFSAFPPGILVGQIHVADPASASAATDVDLAYGSMSTITCGLVISTTMGGGQMLLPNVYCLGAASTINGDLILDGQGDPSSLFIFKIDGALATTVDSRVILTNSASICNVYWQVNGQVDLGDNSLFQGTLLVNGAINLLEAATLNGRALSRAGAISLHNNVVNLVLQPVASPITAGAGATTFCEGDSVTLSGNEGGTWNDGQTTPSITVTTAGDYYVTNTNGCGSDTSNHILVTVNPLPTASTISGGTTTFCEGDSVVLSGNVGGIWSNGETTPSITVTTSGDYSVINTNGCGGVTSNHIVVTVTACTETCSAPVITSVDSVCGNIASVCWTSVPGATGYIVRWNTVPRTTWIYDPVTGTDTCLQFTNQYGIVNQLQVAVICSNGDTSVFSAMWIWTNYLVCAAPAGQTASNITATSADLSWDAVADANKYRVLYKINGVIATASTNGTTLSLTGLPPSTTIKWKVKSRCISCGKNAWGSYSAFSFFTTAALKDMALDQHAASTLLVFPNPATVNFKVSFNIGYSSQQAYTLKVQDLLGHVVMTENGTLADGLLSHDINLTSGMSDGVYFIAITADGKQFSERLVINKD